MEFGEKHELVQEVEWVSAFANMCRDMSAKEVDVMLSHFEEVINKQRHPSDEEPEPE